VFLARPLQQRPAVAMVEPQVAPGLSTQVPLRPVLVLPPMPESPQAALLQLSTAAVVFWLRGPHRAASPPRLGLAVWRAPLLALPTCRSRVTRSSFAEQMAHSTAENMSLSRHSQKSQSLFQQRKTTRFQPNKTPKLRG
jgi:hypothetical protein